MNWSEFNEFSDILDPYLPPSGEGDSVATQIATAVSKLVYKWFNDGDVYDNRYHMEGWCNDISDFANWLYTYIPTTRSILDRITKCKTDDDYEQLLYDLCSECIDTDYIAGVNDEPKKGSVYDCDGPFAFVTDDDYDEDDWYEEDDEYYDEDDEY